MPDDMNSRGPQDRPRVSLTEGYEVRYRTKALGVTGERLLPGRGMVLAVGSTGPMLEHDMAQQEPTYPRPPFMDKLVKFGADTPLGRPGQPAEIAAQYVLLASQEASVTTGNVRGSTRGETGP